MRLGRLPRHRSIAQFKVSPRYPFPGDRSPNRLSVPNDTTPAITARTSAVE